MLMVKLIRHNLKHDPTWVIVNESVAIGTLYEVIAYESKMVLVNHDTGKWYETPTYYVEVMVVRDSCHVNYLRQY